MTDALHLVVEELENDTPSVDFRAVDEQEVVIGVEKRAAAKRRRTERGQNIAEDLCIQQVLGRGTRTASEADSFDWRIFGDEATLAAYEGLAEAVVFGAEMVQLAVAFGTNPAAVLAGRKLGKYADIAAAKMMQKPFPREMRAPTPRADLAYVQMMT
jgi:hypothetical protein